VIFLREEVLALNFLSSWLLSLTRPVTQVRKQIGVPHLCPLKALEKYIKSFIIRELQTFYIAIDEWSWTMLQK